MDVEDLGLRLLKFLILFFECIAQSNEISDFVYCYDMNFTVDRSV